MVSYDVMNGQTQVALQHYHAGGRTENYQVPQAWTESQRFVCQTKVLSPTYVHLISVLNNTIETTSIATELREVNEVGVNYTSLFSKS